METNTVDSDHWEAYRATTYEALGDGEVLWSVRVDEPAPVDGPMAYITSDNPRSEQREDEENFARRAELKDELDASFREVTAGRSVAADGSWPDEFGFWVRPVARDEARIIGEKYKQNAVLFVDENRAVQLVACRR